jgi:hypothetical protein
VIHFDTVFGVLVRGGVEFIVIGGAAATIIGDLDLLGEVTGGGNFEALLAHSSPVQAFGIECLCLNLDKLIQVKRAAGRPRTWRQSPSWKRCVKSVGRLARSQR